MARQNPHPIYSSCPLPPPPPNSKHRIGEKFIEWSDTNPSLDHIILNISLYWFTGGFPRSIYPYRDLFSGKRSPMLGQKIEKPTGLSFFKYELGPIIEYRAAKHCDLVYYRQHERGGHFAALEQPETFWSDIEAFVGKAWKV
jgi:microsomal epoxide hydrolase